MTNTAPEFSEERPVLQEGDLVELSLGREVIVGTLLTTMSGEGQTDGLLKVREARTNTVVFVYERHIRTVRRFA